MHMCVTTILYTCIIVFSITAGGFLLGKAMKFGDSDVIVDMNEEEK